MFPRVVNVVGFRAGCAARTPPRRRRRDRTRALSRRCSASGSGVWDLGVASAQVGVPPADTGSFLWEWAQQVAVDQGLEVGGCRLGQGRVSDQETQFDIAVKGCLGEVA